MPHKRKASDITDAPHSKRAALLSTNEVVPDSPSRQRRSARQSTITATPTTTPKVRRTYGKRAEKELEALQVHDPPDAHPETEMITPSPINGHKAVAGTRGSKRRSERTKAIEELNPQPVGTPRRSKRIYTQIVVEVPQSSSTKVSQPTVPPPDPSLLLETSESFDTPHKSKAINHVTRSPLKGLSILACEELPPQLHPCLNAQKKAILQVLHAPSQIFKCEENSDKKTAKELLQDLLRGTVIRSEGNSCLLLGPPASGKSTILDQCLTSLPESPIVIRLSGWIHHTDRLAMREIAYQLSQQTGKSFLQTEGEAVDFSTAQDDNPFLDHTHPQAIDIGLALPPPSQLPALISVIPTLSRPTVIILDAFDLFALHPRQALLYCLFDTVQGCRTGMDHKGFAVIGITSRIDTVNLLEKRVKSRFSGRVIRTTGVSTITDVLSLIRRALSTPIPPAEQNPDDWNGTWSKRTSQFLEEKKVLEMIKDTVGVAKDPRLLFRILTNAVARLSPNTPFLSPSIFSQAIASQRSRPPLYDSMNLPYPALCLLIASTHSVASGHDVFTFEMLLSAFHIRLRASVAAPVQVNGGSIGMVRCNRVVLLSAFEHLISSRMFVAAAPPSNSITKEFTRYRMTLEIDDVRKVVEKTGQVTLKKWLNKAE